MSIIIICNNVNVLLCKMLHVCKIRYTYVNIHISISHTTNSSIVSSIHHFIHPSCIYNSFSRVCIFYDVCMFLWCIRVYVNPRYCIYYHLVIRGTLLATWIFLLVLRSHCAIFQNLLRTNRLNGAANHTGVCSLRMTWERLDVRFNFGQSFSNVLSIPEQRCII